MRGLVQWTRRHPQDWEEFDTSSWASLPRRPIPTTLGGLDDEPGHVFRLNIQGAVFDGDHYAVQDTDAGGCRVTVWNDDAEDYPDGWLSARVWMFLPLAPDPRFNGQVNTRQSRVIYAQPQIAQRYLDGGADPSTIRPWDDFNPPPPELTRHGVWVDPPTHDAHEAVRSIRGWREWTEGVDPRFIERGLVAPGRRMGLQGSVLDGRGQVILR